MAKELGVDVAVYQPANLQAYKDAGASFAIVKVSEGTGYHSPVASQQVASAKRAGMQVMGYFFATFSVSSAKASLEAEVAVNAAKAAGIPVGSYLAVDWEIGDGNLVNGPTSYNTSAIMSAMRVIKSNGYKPLLYSGAYILRSHVYVASVIKDFPNSIWVASYPTTAPVTTPDFSYFPSMDGVAIWQYTDNWRGMHVDGNVALIELKTGSEGVDLEMSWHPEVRYSDLGIVMVNRKDGADLYSDASLTKKTGHRTYGQTFLITRAAKGAICAGQGQWFSQADVLTKINPLAVNTDAPAIFKISTETAWTQNDANSAAKGIKRHFKGETFKAYGRKGKYLIVGSQQDGKYLDADKGAIVL